MKKLKLETIKPGAGLFAVTEPDSNYFGKKAAGCLIYCYKTKRFLLLKRSEFVNEPRTWNIISGALEENESPLQGLEREIKEETNKKVVIYPQPYYIFKDKNFQFYNFFAIVDNEFTPKLDWENSSYMWLKLEDFTKMNLHFGVKEILKNITKIFALIKKYDNKRIN